MSSINLTAKESYRRSLEKKVDTPPPQDIHPTPEELALLARQEAEMHARAVERVRESKAKMDSLRIRDEEERKRKEQVSTSHPSSSAMCN